MHLGENISKLSEGPDYAPGAAGVVHDIGTRSQNPIQLSEADQPSQRRMETACEMRANSVLFFFFVGERIAHH